MAYASTTGIRIGRNVEGRLVEWISEPIPGDLYDKEAAAEAAGRIVGNRAHEVDTDAAGDLIQDAGYTPVGEFEHDGVDGLMIEVAPK